MTPNNTSAVSVNRSSRSLNGRWDLRIDADGTGIEDEWQRDDPWPTADRRSVSVPHAWQEVDGLRDYTGVAWYRRTVEVDDVPDGQRAFVRFGAVDYHATVWVNGVECGDHRGGYLPFEMDVTEALEDGENVVTVRVEDPEDISEIPHGKQGDPWYTRVSGIWQDVSLELRPAVRVANAHVTPDLDDDFAHVEFDLADDTEGLYGDLTVNVHVVRDGERVASDQQVVEDDGTGIASIHVPDAEYWHPENPVIYDLEIELRDGSETLDVYEDYFGMRSIGYEDGQILLNGDPFYIRGALDQGYYPETLYRPFEENLFEREIETAKELGFNLLRKHIKPAHPDFLELADRMGMLVWEEPANPARYTERSKREVRDQFRELVDRDFNRPSVVIWSLYNEEWGIGHHHDEPFIWDDEEKQAYLGELYETAKQWDPTRLVCDNSGWAHVATDINDYHRYFASPDRSAAWGADLDHITAHPHENYAATCTDPADTPVLISEFGTWGLSDTEALEEFYGGEPEWYNHPFLTPTDGPTNERQVHLESNLRSPAGFKQRFEETTLSETFDSLSDLAETWQWREFLSVKDLIEQMRVHEGISGYVLTEFTDIEWEFNGVLDYRREQKAFHDEFARVNDSVLVTAEPTTHVTWADESLEVRVNVVNDERSPQDGTVKWKLTDDGGSIVERGALDVTVGAHGRTATEYLTVSTPAVGEYEQFTLAVEYESETTLATNEEPLTVVAPTRPVTRDVTVFAQEDYVADRLIGARNDVTRELTADVDVAVVSHVDHGVREFVEAGGDALLIPPAHEAHPHTDLFDFRELPPGENWNLCSALYAHDSPLLTDLTGSKRLGWTFEDIYPNAMVTGLDADTDDIHVEYVEGWIANWGSPLVTRSVGGGTVCVTTFPLGPSYGDHPVATLLFERLVEKQASD